MKECAYGGLEGALQKETEQKAPPWTVSQSDSGGHQENYGHRYCSPPHPLFVSYFRLSVKLFGVLPCHPSIVQHLIENHPLVCFKSYCRETDFCPFTFSCRCKRYDVVWFVCMCRFPALPASWHFRFCLVLIYLSLQL